MSNPPSYQIRQIIDEKAGVFDLIDCILADEIGEKSLSIVTNVTLDFSELDKENEAAMRSIARMPGSVIWGVLNDTERRLTVKHYFVTRMQFSMVGMAETYSGLVEPTLMTFVDLDGRLYGNSLRGTGRLVHCNPIFFDEVRDPIGLVNMLDAERIPLSPFAKRVQVDHLQRSFRLEGNKQAS